MKKSILLLLFVSFRAWAQTEATEIDFNAQTAQLNAAEIIAASHEIIDAQESELEVASQRELENGKIEIKARGMTYTFPSLEEWKEQVENLKQLTPEELSVVSKRRANYLKAVVTALHYTKFIYGTTGIVFDPIKAGLSYGFGKLKDGFGYARQLYSRVRGNPIYDLAERELEPKERSEKNILKRSQQIIDRWVKGIDQSFVEGAYLSRRKNEVGILINGDAGYLAGFAKSFVGDLPGLQVMIAYNTELKSIVVEASVYDQKGLETNMPFVEATANARVGFYRAVTERGKILATSTLTNYPSPPMLTWATEKSSTFQAITFGMGASLGTADAAIFSAKKDRKIIFRTNVGTLIGMKRYYYSDGKAVLVFAKDSVVDLFESIALMVPQYRLVACKRLFAF